LTFRDRYRDFSRRWRRKRASRKQTELREFIYLDEVSVYSLIASRLGPIAAEFTETQTSSLQGEAASSIGAGMAGLAKAGLSTRVVGVETQGTQVLRRSVVQTTFKELYDLERESLAMKPVPESQRLPEIRSISQLTDEAQTLTKDGWIVDSAGLARGRLLEVEVRLKAEDIFRVSAVVSSLLDILDGNPELFGPEAYSELSKARAVGRVLEKLLTGLVPVRGRAVDYVVLEVGGAELIVHRRLLEGLQRSDAGGVHPLYVVGVAEQGLFWKDIRRVLFSEARYRALCRLAVDRVQASWTPVKLAQVLETLLPGVAERINALGSGALAAMTEAGKSERASELQQERFREALTRFAALLAEHYGGRVTPDDLSEGGLPSVQHCAGFADLNTRRAAFDAVAAFVLARLGEERDPFLVADCRTAALADVGLDATGHLASLPSSAETSIVPATEDRFLDSEFVAIYW